MEADDPALHRHRIRDRRVDLRRRLEPDLHFVAVGVAEEDVGLARREVALADDLGAESIQVVERSPDRAGLDEPKAEVLDPASLPRRGALLLEDQDVPATRSLRLDPTVTAVDLDHPEELAVELERTLRVAHRERDVGEPVGLDHSPILPAVRLSLGGRTAGRPPVAPPASVSVGCRRHQQARRADVDRAFARRDGADGLEFLLAELAGMKAHHVANRFPRDRPARHLRAAGWRRTRTLPRRPVRRMRSCIAKGVAVNVTRVSRR